MAVVELQFRERSFLELVGSEALRPPLASRVLDEVRRRNAEPQAARLRLTSIEWAQPFLRARAPEWGTALVKATMAIELTGQSVRVGAGAGGGPPGSDRRLTAEAWIEVSVGRHGPCWRIAELRVVAPVSTLGPAATVPLMVGEHLPAVDHGAVLLGDGIVSIRLASTPDDDVSYAVEDRLEGHDWARFVAGDLLADSVADAVNDALAAVTAWPGGDVRVDERATAAWWGGSGPPAPEPPRARATCRLVGVGALPFAFDLPFTLTAETRFALASRPTSAAPPMLSASTVVGVHAADPDVLDAFGALDLLRDELRTAFDGHLDSTPAGAVVSDERGGSLRIDTRLVLTVPATRAWAGVAVRAGLDGSGLAVRGILALRQPGEIDLRDRRGLDWSRHRPHQRAASGDPGGAVSVP